MHVSSWNDYHEQGATGQSETFMERTSHSSELYMSYFLTFVFYSDWILQSCFFGVYSFAYLEAQRVDLRITRPWGTFKLQAN